MKSILNKLHSLNIRMKQKLIGLSLILVSLILLFALDEGTPAVIFIPLGLYLIITREIHIYKD